VSRCSRRITASCSKGCAARTASPSCAARKASPRTSTIAGPRSSSKPARSRLAGDTAREATSDEVKELRAEARQLREALAEATIENRLLKKSVIAEGFDRFYTVPTAATARDRLLLALRRDYSEYFCLPLGGGVPLRTPSARLWPQAGPRLASRWSEDQAAPQPNIAVEAG
jgi:hypothetical protein